MAPQNKGTIEVDAARPIQPETPAQTNVNSGLRGGHSSEAWDDGSVSEEDEADFDQEEVSEDEEEWSDEAATMHEDDYYRSGDTNSCSREAESDDFTQGPSSWASGPHEGDFVGSNQHRPGEKGKMDSCCCTACIMFFGLLILVVLVSLSVCGGEQDGKTKTGAVHSYCKFCSARVRGAKSVFGSRRRARPPGKSDVGSEKEKEEKDKNPENQDDDSGIGADKLGVPTQISLDEKEKLTNGDGDDKNPAGHGDDSDAKENTSLPSGHSEGETPAAQIGVIPTGPVLQPPTPVVVTPVPARPEIPIVKQDITVPLNDITEWQDAPRTRDQTAAARGFYQQCTDSQGGVVLAAVRSNSPVPSVAPPRTVALFREASDEFLGVELDYRTASASQNVGVKKVIPNSAAHHAGVQVGDDLFGVGCAYFSWNLPTSSAAVQNFKYRCASENRLLAFRVVRGGRTRVVLLDFQAMGGVPGLKLPGKLGGLVNYPESGLRIQADWVVEGGAAQRAGLRGGDTITGMGSVQRWSALPVVTGGV